MSVYRNSVCSEVVHLHTNTHICTHVRTVLKFTIYLFKAAFARNPKLGNLLLDAEFAKDINARQASLRFLVSVHLFVLSLTMISSITHHNVHLIH